MKSKQQGFTILELMIASSVFSIILLLTSVAIIRIGQTYNKGIVASRTQEAARAVLDEITRNIQFTGGSVSFLPVRAGGTRGPVYGFCIDSRRYSYLLDRELTDGTPDTTGTQSNHVFVTDIAPTACGPAASPLTAFPQQLDGSVGLPPAQYRELLGVSMRLDADPHPTDPSLPLIPCTSLCRVSLKVVYGQQDILVGSPFSYGCVANFNGGHFCAVSQLTSVVKKRVQ